ncbi:hypothetical protein [Litoribacillus peritrichatus]|uniref:Uncharacterized protein n=1 Tax=Litoribacillus peritrichatus TaxID=718191 RepID=A0ABP7M436_9GAMM
MNSANDNLPTVEAVLLFKGAQVVEQMLYSEFEGILDHVSNFPGYADERVKGCYVRVNPNLTIAGVIFFYLDFDDFGYADRSWCLPLRRLMGQAGMGPDLGAGPVHLVCRTRCPQVELREEFWDPSIQPGMNHFQILKSAIQQNKLNINDQLAVSQASLSGCIDIPVVVNEDEDAKNRRDKLAEVIKNQRFRIEALTNECDDKVNELTRARRHDQIQFNEKKRLFAQKFEQLKVKYLKQDEQMTNAVALIARLLGVDDPEVIKEHLEDLRAVGNLADLSTGEGNTEQMELIQTKAENYLLTQQLVQLKRACSVMNQKLRVYEEANMPKVTPITTPPKKVS